MSFSNNTKQSIKTIPLSKTEYTRPHETQTDKLQDPKLFREKLKGYTAVDDIDNVPMNSHMRYFTFSVKDRRWKFRMGGIITYKHPKYIVLSNGRVSWSVQRKIYNDDTNDVYETKFFRIMAKDEIANIALEAQQKEIQLLKKQNRELQQKLEHYESIHKSSSQSGGHSHSDIGSSIFHMLGNMK